MVSDVFIYLFIIFNITSAVSAKANNLYAWQEEWSSTDTDSSKHAVFECPAIEWLHKELHESLQALDNDPSREWNATSFAGVTFHTTRHSEVVMPHLHHCWASSPTKETQHHWKLAVTHRGSSINTEAEWGQCTFTWVYVISKIFWKASTKFR